MQELPSQVVYQQLGWPTLLHRHESVHLAGIFIPSQGLPAWPVSVSALGLGIALYRRVYPLLFSKVHKEVRELWFEGALSETDIKLYVHLAAHCDVRSGDVHPMSASDAAVVLRCSRRTVYYSISKLRELGLLVGGSGMEGCLPHVKPVIKARASTDGRRRQSLREVASPQNATEGRAVAAAQRNGGSGAEAKALREGTEKLNREAHAFRETDEYREMRKRLQGRK